MVIIVVVNERKTIIKPQLGTARKCHAFYNKLLANILEICIFNIKIKYLQQALESSFGTQKEHYDLKRVKARTKQTEILYIFFGIHTANVVQLAKRIEQRALLEAA